jgi:hypothetical protein
MPGIHAFWNPPHLPRGGFLQTLAEAAMNSAMTTTYLGHRINIEPFEWGYLAHIVELESDRRLIAARTSALQALEDAFDAVDEMLRTPKVAATS